MNERRAGGAGAFAGRNDALLDAVTAEHDRAAVAADGSHLRDRCLARHEHLAGDATRVCCVGQ